FSSRRRHTRSTRDWSSDVCSSDLLAYNTRLVRKQDLPKSYEDLAHPRWRGKLGIEADDADWLAGVFAQLGEARGVRIFQEIVAEIGRASCRERGERAGGAVAVVEK